MTEQDDGSNTGRDEQRPPTFIPDPNDLADLSRLLHGLNQPYVEQVLANFSPEAIDVVGTLRDAGQTENPLSSVLKQMSIQVGANPSQPSSVDPRKLLDELSHLKRFTPGLVSAIDVLEAQLAKQRETLAALEGIQETVTKRIGEAGPDSSNLTNLANTIGQESWDQLDGGALSDFVGSARELVGFLHQISDLVQQGDGMPDMGTLHRLQSLCRGVEDFRAIAKKKMSAMRSLADEASSVLASHEQTWSESTAEPGKGPDERAVRRRVAIARMADLALSDDGLATRLTMADGPWEQALEVALVGGHFEWATQIADRMMLTYLARGDLTGAAARSEQVANSAFDAGDVTVTTRHLGRACAVMLKSGDLDRAEALAERMSEVTRLGEAPECVIEACVARAAIFAERGDLESAATQLQTASALHDVIGDEHKHRMVQIWVLDARLKGTTEALESVLTSLEKARETAIQWGTWQHLGYVAMGSVEVLARLERPVTAVAHLLRCRTAATRTFGVRGTKAIDSLAAQLRAQWGEEKWQDILDRLEAGEAN